MVINSRANKYTKIALGHYCNNLYAVINADCNFNCNFFYSENGYLCSDNPKKKWGEKKFQGPTIFWVDPMVNPEY